MLNHDVIPDVLLVLGVGLEVIAALGVAVMRDVLDRLHYVSVASFGALLVGGAILCDRGFSLLGDKALVSGAILVIVGPTVVHTTARSLRTRTLGDWREGIDELRVEDE